MGGYNAPTTDSWDVLRRRRAETDAAIGEALRPNGSQVRQTSRKVVAAVERLSELELDMEGLDALAAAVLALRGRPISAATTTTAAGFGLTAGGWITVASAELDWMPGTELAVLQATASGHVASAASSSVECRIVVASTPGEAVALPVVPDGSDHRAPLLAVAAIQLAPAASIIVEVQAKATPAATVPAAPGNVALLAVSAVFIPSDD